MYVLSHADMASVMKVLVCSNRVGSDGDLKLKTSSRLAALPHRSWSAPRSLRTPSFILRDLPCTQRALWGPESVRDVYRQLLGPLNKPPSNRCEPNRG